ncbi:MAG: PaaI family thioesterase [Chloroflexota bacterium]|nr:PaaI family thioesterase [Chloroflexota bacterium]MDQ5866611.1 PaaI family thioesterase [Chloroflexota bacterium]
MEATNPNYQEAVREVFARAAFVNDVGIRLTGCGPGWCESELAIAPRHYQHHDFVHAGVQATIADHTAGAAATTLIRATEVVLSAEFKINLLNTARGERLRCRAQVLKAGRMLIVAESEVFAGIGAKERLVSKATVTLAVVAVPETTTEEAG